jgi:hypothetical protein
LSATYYWLEDKVLAVCPKAGSTSIRKLELKEIMPSEVYARQVDCLWFIRHPVARLHSCYRYIKTAPGSDTRSKKRLPDFATYEEFIDSVLAGETNRHWDQQIPMVTNPVFLPTEVHRFEDIHRYINIPWLLYKEDLQLWQSV